jgi:hypothetical protein
VWAPIALPDSDYPSFERFRVAYNAANTAWLEKAAVYKPRFVRCMWRMAPLSLCIVYHWLALTYHPNGALAKALAQHFKERALDHFVSSN